MISGITPMTVRVGQPLVERLPTSIRHCYHDWLENGKESPYGSHDITDASYSGTVRQHNSPVNVMLHEQFRQVAPEGAMVEYLGKTFVVYPKVFWPSDDSMPLVQHFSIEPGDRVLDLCTGSGVIAIMAAYAGASSVLALDNNPAAVRTARKNAALHQFSGVIDVRESDLFAAIAPGETFDVITMNPPYTPHPVSAPVEASTWDSGFALHQRFFATSISFSRQAGGSTWARPALGHSTASRPCHQGRL